MKRFFLVGFVLACLSNVATADVVILSDNFSRTPVNTIVGTAPSRSTTTPATWTSSWGANNNSNGGNVTQTYTTYVDGSLNYKIEGTNGTTGNWLNNGSASHPLTGAVNSTEPIGLPGFAWVQINHDFSANTDVSSASSLRISFDVHRPTGGNIAWFFGQSDATGANNGNAGSPATVAANDIALYFRGTQAQTFGLREDGLLPTPVTGIASYDTMSYATGTNISASTNSMSVQIDIFGTNFTTGQSSTLELRVNGILQDLNGTAAAGAEKLFTWNGTGAYMGFSSNNTAVLGAVGSETYRAAGIDNLVITAVPEPGTLSLCGLAGLGLVYRRFRRFSPRVTLPSTQG
jgi:hypothetical protein